MIVNLQSSPGGKIASNRVAMSNCPIRTAELHVTDSPDCVNDVQYLIEEGLARVLKYFLFNSSPFYGVHNVTLLKFI